MSSDEAPSAGTKVNLGGQAPVKHEGTGAVPEDSLAAESIKSGGAFASNPGAKPGSEPAPSQDHGSGPRRRSRSKSKGRKKKDEDDDPLRHQYSYGGPAPTYVVRQYQKYPGPPKGKNLQEGGFEGEGPGDSIKAEPLSEQDPAREAERDLLLHKYMVHREGGPKEYHLDPETPYDGLDEETA